jgi:hypothetical protein
MLKIEVSPTYTPEIVALSVCDIITLSIQGMAGVICYLFQPFKHLNCLRYPNNIAKMAEFVLWQEIHDIS